MFWGKKEQKVSNPEKLVLTVLFKSGKDYQLTVPATDDNRKTLTDLLHWFLFRKAETQYIELSEGYMAFNRNEIEFMRVMRR